MYRAPAPYFATYREHEGGDLLYTQQMDMRSMEIMQEELKAQGVVDLQVYRVQPTSRYYGRFDGNPHPQFGYRPRRPC